MNTSGIEVTLNLNTEDAKKKLAEFISRLEATREDMRDLEERSLRLKSDAFLVTWLLLSFAWDFAVLGTASYVVFWKGHSGWWFLLAVPLTWADSLYKSLRKRFTVKGEK